MSAPRTEREQMERFAAIVRSGGEILVASDIDLARFCLAFAGFGAGALATRVRVEPWLAPGTVCAVSRKQLERSLASRAGSRVEGRTDD